MTERQAPACAASLLPAGAASLAERTLLAALEASPDGFAVHRVHRAPGGGAVTFTLVSINRAGAATYDGDPAELVGRSLTELVPDGESTGIPGAFRRAADSGQLQRLRTSFTGRDWSGTMDICVTAIDQDHVLATWRDVTDRARSEAVIIDAYRQAQSAWESLLMVVEIVSDPVITLSAPADTADTADTGMAARLRAITVDRVNAAAATTLGMDADGFADACTDQDLGPLNVLAQAITLPVLDLEDLVAAVLGDQQPRILRRLDLDVHGDTTSVLELHASMHDQARVIIVIRRPE